MFCPSCGRENKEGASFCSACGKPLARAQVSSGAPPRDSLEGSMNRLGIKAGSGMLRTVVVSSIVGLVFEYLILPIVGVGVLTGYDPLSNEVLIGFVSFLASFGVAYKMRGARRGPVPR